MDHIVACFAEVTSGTETGDYLLFDLTISSKDGVISWRCNEVWFNWDFEGGYIVSPYFSSNSGNCSETWSEPLSIIDWKPGDSLKCHYKHGYSEVDLVFPKTKSEFRKGTLVASGTGFTKTYDYGPKLPYELVEITEMQLKSKILRPVPNGH
jgi:hypothetical protein